MIAEDDVFAFVERHRSELATSPNRSRPGPCVTPRRFGSTAKWSSISHRRTKSLLEVEITFRAGNETIAADGDRTRAA